MAQQVMSSLMTEDRLPQVVLYLDTCAVVHAHTQPHQIRTKAENIKVFNMVGTGFVCPLLTLCFIPLFHLATVSASLRWNRLAKI